MRLYIAEKPSMALEIARCLFANKSLDKTSARAGSYQHGDNIVTWLVGHVLTPFTPEQYNKTWGKWSLDTLPINPPIWKKQISLSTKEQFMNVQKLLAKLTPSDEIIHAGDPDREGRATRF